MEKNVLIINGHPSRINLSQKIMDAYVNGAKESNKKIKILNLRDLKFDPVLWEGYSSDTKLEKDLIKSQELIIWADHIVFIFPIWWGSMPALLKGWIDRVFLPGFSFKYRKGKTSPEKLLKGKTSEIIRTSGSSTLISFIPEILDGLNWRYNILGFNGIKLTKTTHFSGITSSISEKKVEQILDKVRKLGKKKFN